MKEKVFAGLLNTNDYESIDFISDFLNKSRHDLNLFLWYHNIIERKKGKWIVSEKFERKKMGRMNLLNPKRKNSETVMVFNKKGLKFIVNLLGQAKCFNKQLAIPGFDDSDYSYSFDDIVKEMNPKYEEILLIESFVPLSRRENAEVKRQKALQTSKDSMWWCDGKETVSL
jgi:hypothetical protein